MRLILRTRFFALGILALLTFSCQGNKPGPKALGLKKTPEMLYKSFRAAGPTAYSGAAPEMAGDVDLSPYFPAPGDQGNIGSCTAWATAYAAKSFQENREREWGVKDKGHQFSPSYIYNQINGGVDGGSPIESAISLMVEKGCASFGTFPYTQDYRKQPDKTAHQEALNFKAKSFARVNFKDANAIKQVLLGGNAVIIGMLLYENFYFYSGGVYDKIGGNFLGGHAMCTIGYDDKKAAFKIINSWGPHWGEGGYVWVSYDIFTAYVATAIVMYDEVSTVPQEAAVPVNIEASKGAAVTEITVTWARAKNAIGYKIYRSDNPREYFTETGITKGTTFIDKDVVPGKEYYYAVQSLGADSPSALSESVRGYAGILAAEVPIPQKIEALFDTNAVYLKWNAISGVDGYFVYKFDKGADNYLRIGTTADANFKDTGTFQDKDVLWYIVTAHRFQVEGQPSQALAVSVEIKPLYSKVKPPRGLNATQGEFEDKITLSWKPVAGAEEYTVYLYDENNKTWNEIITTKEAQADHLNPQLPGAYYAVAARNPDFISEKSDSVFGFTRAYIPPAEPQVTEYDDKDYYDDREITDTDYKDEDLYIDDKKTKKDEHVVFDNFDDDTTKEDKKIPADQPETDKKAEKKATKQDNIKKDTPPVKEETAEEFLDRAPIRDIKEDETKTAEKKRAEDLVEDAKKEDFMDDKAKDDFFNTDDSAQDIMKKKKDK